ncbi:unnamed protein product [Cylicostephanus goldi]|uniref:Uncharacterized protein n=1 Tax=Cylicostephanus goldi TaxID=71465 RepID=A0A3P6RKT0_CYLGO|nr:unnamed protein product [Cylicostephanus goldi]
MTVDHHPVTVHRVALHWQVLKEPNLLEDCHFQCTFNELSRMEL